MKYNKILFALTLCAAMQPNMSFCMENSLQEEITKMGQTPQSQTRWQRYAPQFMQNTTSYISKQATSVYDTVNNWSTRKKIIVAGTILTALAAVYNRDQIMQWVSGLLQTPLIKEYIEAAKNTTAADNEFDRLRNIPQKDRTPEHGSQIRAAREMFAKSFDQKKEITDKLLAQGMSEYAIRHLK